VTKNDHIASQTALGQSISRPETTPYTYEPLDATRREIRLIKLREDKESPIRTNISIFALENAPDYTALSYVWGEPGTTYNVFIDGKHIEIRKNLHQCLQELREEEEGYLWIDEICINQVDIQERNAQVKLMSSIYRSSVIGWLECEIALYRKQQANLKAQGI
jgi:hypothetical protein